MRGLKLPVKTKRLANNAVKKPLPVARNVLMMVRLSAAENPIQPLPPSPADRSTVSAAYPCDRSIMDLLSACRHRFLETDWPTGAEEDMRESEGQEGVIVDLNFFSCQYLARQTRTRKTWQERSCDPRSDKGTKQAPVCGKGRRRDRLAPRGQKKEKRSDDAKRDGCECCGLLRYVMNGKETERIAVSRMETGAEA